MAQPSAHSRHTNFNITAHCVILPTPITNRGSKLKTVAYIFLYDYLIHIHSDRNGDRDGRGAMELVLLWVIKNYSIKRLLTHHSSSQSASGILAVVMDVALFCRWYNKHSLYETILRISRGNE